MVGWLMRYALVLPLRYDGPDGPLLRLFDSRLGGEFIEQLDVAGVPARLTDSRGWLTRKGACTFLEFSFTCTHKVDAVMDVSIPAIGSMLDALRGEGFDIELDGPFSLEWNKGGEGPPLVRYSRNFRVWKGAPN